MGLFRGACSSRGWLLVALWMLLAGIAFGQAGGGAAVPLLLPAGVAYDGAGNLYFTESGAHRVRRLTVDGVLTVVAGNGVQGFAGDGGAAMLAEMDTPAAIVVDEAGDVYVADTHNHVIRRIDAGTGVIATEVRTPMPSALAMTATGVLVWADSALHRVFAGGGAGAAVVVGDGVQADRGDGGAATDASVDAPSGLAFDSVGNLYVADAHSQRVRRVDAATGVITTVAGTGVAGFGGDGGAARGARLAMPRGLAADDAGGVYVADAANQRVRRVDAATGMISTVAGDGTEAYRGDGRAAATAALDSPAGVALDGAGMLVIGDRLNQRVRRVGQTGMLTTIAGADAGAVAAAKTATTTALSQVLTVGVTSAKGVPGGTVQLEDGAGVIATQTLAGGVASFASATLSNGSHTLTAAYAGDAEHLPSVSAPVIVTAGGGVAGDFTLASSGAASASSLPATFSFTATPVGAALASTIQLSAAGLPPGASASFAPAYLVPAGVPVTFTLAIGPAVAEVGGVRGWVVLVLAVPLAVPLVGVRGAGRGRRLAKVLCLGLMLVGINLALAGCGDRTNGQATGRTPVKSYTVVVSGTATSAAGATLVHTAQVTLTLVQ